jgi:hypothetical protein
VRLTASDGAIRHQRAVDTRQRCIDTSDTGNFEYFLHEGFSLGLVVVVVMVMVMTVVVMMVMMTLLAIQFNC